MKIKECPISGSQIRIDFLDLGNTPIGGNFTDTREESLTAKQYPMALQFFPASKLVSMIEPVESEIMYANYLYHSGVSLPYRIHCQNMYEYLLDYVKLKDGDFIIDIGGNDGTLLREFKNLSQQVSLSYMNVEASPTFAEENKAKGIEYFNTYWSEDITCGQKPKLITSTNVFQHSPPIRSMVKGIRKNLGKKSVWCLEFPYFLISLMKNCYDQAYHEHVYYYALAPIKALFEQEGLRIINVSYHEIHDGTLRVLSVRKDSPKEADNSIETFLALEKDFMNEEYLKTWGDKIHKNIRYYKEYFRDLQIDRYRIAAFGAAIKGCAFLTSCGLDYNTIEYVIDDTVEKQGKFIPGTGIEVVDRSILKTNPPTIMLILAHNFKDYIIKSLRESGYKGKFLVMFPDVHIY